MTEGGVRCGDELAAGRIPVVGILGQRARDHRVDGTGQLGPDRARWRRRLLDVSPYDRGVDVLDERDAPGEALVEHAAERVDVCPAVHVRVLDLLRRDVVDRPQQLAGLGQPAA